MTLSGCSRGAQEWAQRPGPDQGLGAPPGPHGGSPVIPSLNHTCTEGPQTRTPPATALPGCLLGERACPCHRVTRPPPGGEWEGLLTTTGGTSRTLSTSSSDRGTYHSVALLVSFVTPSEERSTCVMTKAEAEDRATGDPAGGEALGL